MGNAQGPSGQRKVVGRRPVAATMKPLTSQRPFRLQALLAHGMAKPDRWWDHPRSVSPARSLVTSFPLASQHISAPTADPLLRPIG